jgi:hypothetical protein
MAATPTENPSFIMFVNFMGVELSMDNMAIFTDLFVNFTGFVPQFPCSTLAEKFILWKRYYDEYAVQQQQLNNANTFNMAPKDPRQLKPQIKIEPRLSKLNGEKHTFQNFTFEATKTKDQTPLSPIPNSPPAYEMASTIEVFEENTVATLFNELITTTTNEPQLPHTSVTPAETIIPGITLAAPQRPPPPPYKSPVGDIVVVATVHDPPKPKHQGKNIAQMKVILAESKPQRPTPKKRKRKPEPELLEENEEREERTTPPTIPPGRPTKDRALIQMAVNEDSMAKNDDNDDEPQYDLVDVCLLSGCGSIRKKIKLLTKNEGDIKCFAIRHYAALEYIADKKKKAFNKIKNQRQKLKKLNYLEQNTLKDIKDVKTLYNV